MTPPDPPTVGSIRDRFRSGHQENGVNVPAGPAARRKGEFAEALAGRLRDARYSGGAVVHVPEPLENIFSFLYPPPQAPAAADESEPVSEPESPA